MLRKVRYGRTDGRTNEHEFIGPFSTSWGTNNNNNNNNNNKHAWMVPHVFGVKWMLADEFGHNSCIINEVTNMTQK